MRFGSMYIHTYNKPVRGEVIQGQDTPTSSEVLNEQSSQSSVVKFSRVAGRDESHRLAEFHWTHDCPGIMKIAGIFIDEPRPVNQ